MILFKLKLYIGCPYIKNKSYYTKRSRKIRKKTLKVSGRKEVIKARVKINKVKTKNKIEKINDVKRWFFEKMNKIDKSPARFIRKKWEGPNK